MRRKCSILLVYLLCSLTIILGTNQHVMCFENSELHLQLIGCADSLRHSSSGQTPVFISSSGMNKSCPDCLDVSVPFLGRRDSGSPLLAWFAVGPVFTPVAYPYYKSVNQYDPSPGYLSLALPVETGSLASFLTTVLLI